MSRVLRCALWSLALTALAGLAAGLLWFMGAAFGVPGFLWTFACIAAALIGIGVGLDQHEEARKK